MSTAAIADRPEQLEPPIPAMDSSKPRPTPDKREVRYRCSEQFIPILRHLNASVMVSTYQAGKVATLSARDDQLDLSFANFEQAMGMAVSPGQIAVGSRRQIWFLEAAHEFAGRLGPQDRSTACYLARKAHVTGNIHVHDMAWGGSELWIVNTLFSCLCNLTNVNATLFFRVSDGLNGYELWKSDGTQAGTVMVKDIAPGSDHSFPRDLTNVNRHAVLRRL